MTNDPVALLSRSVEQVGQLLAQIRPEQADLPTPCQSWTIRRLVGHIVDELGQFTQIVEGGSWAPSVPPESPGEDWPGAYRAGADKLLDAWRRSSDLTSVITVPGIGDMPLRFFADLQTTELAVHAWDLTVSVGAPGRLDPEIGEASLAWIRATLTPEFRGSEEEGKGFGPEVPVAPDAPVYNRLAAFAGRDPNFG